MKEKELYTSPESKVMEIRLEGIIAVSPDLAGDGYGNPFKNTPDETDW